MWTCGMQNPTCTKKWLLTELKHAGVHRVYMRRITWRLSLFIIIAAESFHPRWLTNSLAWHSCWQHDIRNWIVELYKFTSGSKNDSILPKLILLRGEQAVLILMAVEMGFVLLHLSYYTLQHADRNTKPDICHSEDVDQKQIIQVTSDQQKQNTFAFCSAASLPLVIKI